MKIMSERNKKMSIRDKYYNFQEVINNLDKYLQYISNDLKKEHVSWVKQINSFEICVGLKCGERWKIDIRDGGTRLISYSKRDVPDIIAIETIGHNIQIKMDEMGINQNILARLVRNKSTRD